MAETSKESGGFEVDESYFGAKRVRGAAGETPILGLLKRDGKVFVTVVLGCSKESLMPIIQGKILEGSTVHSDGWKAYDGLITPKGRRPRAIARGGMVKRENYTGKRCLLRSRIIFKSAP
jgi:transposase-like protein